MPAENLDGPPPYLVGLRLSGLTVVVVGGGAVAARRVPALLRAGAVVRVVAPDLVPDLDELRQQEQLTWLARPYANGDLADAWYVITATSDPAANAAAAAEAERRRVFCVRADSAVKSTAWTPATGEVDGSVVAVLSGRNPARSAALRDRLLELLRAETGPGA